MHSQLATLFASRQPCQVASIPCSTLHLVSRIGRYSYSDSWLVLNNRVVQNGNNTIQTSVQPRGSLLAVLPLRHQGMAMRTSWTHGKTLAFSRTTLFLPSSISGVQVPKDTTLLSQPSFISPSTLSSNQGWSTTFSTNNI